MSVFILISLVAIVFGIIYQIAKASEYAAVLNGEEKVKQQTRKIPVWYQMELHQKSTFLVSESTFKPGFGTGIAETPSILFSGPEDEISGVSRG